MEQAGKMLYALGWNRREIGYMGSDAPGEHPYYEHPKGEHPKGEHPNDEHSNGVHTNDENNNDEVKTAFCDGFMIDRKSVV